MSEQMESTENELDFSNDVNVKTEEKLWTVTGATIEQTDDGTGTFLAIEMTDEETPFPRTEKFWLKHDDVPGKNWEKTVQISRSNAKRFALAATGSPKLDLKDLIGAKFIATISEDQQGFVRINKYKPATAGEAVS